MIAQLKGVNLRLIPIGEHKQNAIEGSAVEPALRFIYLVRMSHNGISILSIDLSRGGSWRKLCCLNESCVTVAVGKSVHIVHLGEQGGMQWRAARLTLINAY